MKFSFNKNRPLCRVFICLVCALVLVGFFCRPVANASAIAIEIGLSTGQIMSVLPEYALIMLLLIGAGWLIHGSLEDLYTASVHLHDSSPHIYQWSHSYSSYDFASLTQLYYNAETRLAVNDYVAIQGYAGLPADDDTHKYYLTVPASMLSLDTLQSSTVIMYDKSTLSAVLNNTELITQTGAAVSNVGTKVDALSSTVAGSAISVKNTLLDLITLTETMHADVGRSLTTFNNNMMSRLDKLSENISDLRTMIGSRFETLGTIVVNTRNQLSSDISDLRSSLTYRLDNIKSSVSAMNEALSWKLDTVNKSIGALGTKIDTIPSTIDVIGSNIESRIKENKDVISGSIDKIPLAIDDLGLQLKESFSTNIDVIDTKLDILIGSSDVANSVVGSFVSTSDEVIAAENALKNSTEQGEENLHLSLNQADSIIGKFANAFLALSAILSMFLSIPIIKDLVEVSLALGIFALLVGLANNLSHSTGNSSAKRKNKGG